MKAKSMALGLTLERDYTITFTLDSKPNTEQINELISHTQNGKLLDVGVKKYRNKRSVTANSYLWILCKKLADKLYITDVEAYRRLIRDVGRYDLSIIHEKSVDYWVTNWNNRGIGWYAMKTRDSEHEGFVIVKNYYGSSVYDTDDMSRVIEAVVWECNSQGIETKSQEDIDSLIASYEAKRKD